MHNVSGYITAFYLAASRLVCITGDEIMDRFVAGLKPKIREKVLLLQADTFEKACDAAKRVGVVFIDMCSSSSNPSWLQQYFEGIYRGKGTGYAPMRVSTQPCRARHPNTNETSKDLLEIAGYMVKLATKKKNYWSNNPFHRPLHYNNQAPLQPSRPQQPSQEN